MTHARPRLCWGWTPVSRMGLLLALVLSLGCGDESLRPPVVPNRTDLYWDLTLNHHAVVLATRAPWDTLAVVATPVNFRDEPLAGMPAPQYRSTDPERVIVGTDGVLRAVAPTSQPVAVVATLTAQNLRHADTLLVSVVDTAAPPVLESLSVHPLSPDSAKTAGITSYPGILRLPQVLDTLPIRALAANGDSLPAYTRDNAGYLPVYFRSSDTAVATIEPPTGQMTTALGVVHGRRAGLVTIYASTTAFGLRKADTLAYRIGVPVLEVVLFERQGSTNTIVNEAPDIRIGVGGAVAFYGWSVFAHDTTDTLDVTFAPADVPNITAISPVFDHIASISVSPFLMSFFFCSYDCDNGGNVVLSRSQFTVGRYFPVPGTYEYHSVKYGVSGRVIVVDER